MTAVTSDLSQLLALVSGLRDSKRSRSATSELGLHGWASRCDALLVLGRAGEQALALEDLCSNLIEFGVPLSPTEHAELMSLVNRADLPRSAWNGLAELVDLDV